MKGPIHAFGAYMRRRDVLGALSGALTLPVSAVAQKARRSYKIAYLALLPGEDKTLAKPFFERLKELGYSDRENVTLTYRSAEGDPERVGYGIWVARGKGSQGRDQHHPGRYYDGR
jgi:hypothetical protein